MNRTASAALAVTLACTVPPEQRAAVLPPRTEEVLSYLIGLAPVGETFWLPRWLIESDLGFRSRRGFCNHIKTLVAAGCLERIPGQWLLFRVVSRHPAWERA